jgi:ribulose-phosphate 3-epimerase
MKYLINPSILSANFAYLASDICSVVNAGANRIHFDVMDNHYVPNLSFGPILLRSLINSGIKIGVDIHLMVGLERRHRPCPPLKSLGTG